MTTTADYLAHARNEIRDVADDLKRARLALAEVGLSVEVIGAAEARLLLVLSRTNASAGVPKRRGFRG